MATVRVQRVLLSNRSAAVRGGSRQGEGGWVCHPLLSADVASGMVGDETKRSRLLPAGEVGEGDRQPPTEMWTWS